MKSRSWSSVARLGIAGLALLLSSGLRPASGAISLARFDSPPVVTHLTDSAVNQDLDGQALELSGATLNTTISGGGLFVVDDGAKRLYKFNAHGEFQGDVRLEGFDDTEGITWMGGNRYAIVEERTGEISVVRIDSAIQSIVKSGSSSDTVALAQVLSPDFGFDINVPINTGIEGIAHDSTGSRFFVAKERSTGHGVYEVDYHFDASGDVVLTSPQATLLFAGASVGLDDLSGLHYDYNPGSGHLFIVSQADERVVETTLSGDVVHTLGISGSVPSGSGGLVEGITFSASGDTMYLLGEPDELYTFTASSTLPEPNSQDLAPEPSSILVWLGLAMLAAVGGRRARSTC